jgi:hypothetical protein
MNTRGRERHDPPAATSHHASSSPDISARSRHTLGSESATLAASTSTYHEGEQGGTGGTPSIITATSSFGSQPPEPEDPDIHSLSQRLPVIGDVVSALRVDYHVLQVLDTPGVFDGPNSRAEFIASYFSHSPGSEDFWDEAWEHMYNAIFMNIPTRQSQVKKCKDEYIHDINFILDEHFAMVLPEKYWNLNLPEKMKLHCICKRIGIIFVDVFESMISMPGGKRIVAIKDQLQTCLDRLSSKCLDDYFEDGIDVHVYYVAGYLCHAGKKASTKRKGDLGRCLASLSVHFVSTAAEVETVKADLPSGIASLVDERAVHGILTYPDRQFYSFIARIEFCYAELATPENLMVFGGGVLSTICDAIASHELFRDHFSSLLDDNSSFNPETIQETMEFYIKVFSNLRLKDLCRKYNSRLSKTNTVGIRQSLAANRKPTRVKQRKRDAMDEGDEDIDIPADELHLELEQIAERGLDDDVDIDSKDDSIDDSDNASNE